MQLSGRSLENGSPISLEIERGVIASVGPIGDEAGLPWILPGLVDLQVNGLAGIEFSSGSLRAEQVGEVAERLAQGGVTRFCPTLTTNTHDALAAGLATIAAACAADSRLAYRVAGIHLEGPYISPSDGPRGAHPRAPIRPPDWDEFQRLQAAAEGRIRIVTLSPEYEAASEFIRRAVASGVVVALAHLDATAPQIAAAVEAGARLSTHLGNGCHSVLPRHPNYLWDQMSEDRLWASLIVDGHHLPPAVVKALVRAKRPERIVLVSDLASTAGLPPGVYESIGGKVEVLPEGRIVVAGQTTYLAGAAAPLLECLANVVAMAEISWAEALPMATSRPAELLGLAPPKLTPGSPADLVVCDPLPGGRLVARQVFVAGEAVRCTTS